MEKQTKTNKYPSEYNWTPLGKPIYILSIIFCVLECILAVLLVWMAINLFATNGATSQQIGTGVAYIIVALVIFIFGIIATVNFCKRTKAGEHINMGLACCSIFFFNPVCGILAVVYSAQTTK